MGLRRAQGSRIKQRDSHERPHTLSRSSRVRQRGMRLPSGRGAAPPFTNHKSLFTNHQVFRPLAFEHLSHGAEFLVALFQQELL